MPVSNAEIAAIFSQVADLLEIQGENPFRVRAYRVASRTVGDLARSAAQMAREGEGFSRLSRHRAGPGRQDPRGRGARHHRSPGRVAPKMPGELARLLEVAGLGPKRVQVLWRQLGITTLKELEAAATAGKIRALPGFGEKTEGAIVKDLGRVAAAERGASSSWTRIRSASTSTKSTAGSLRSTE